VLLECVCVYLQRDASEALLAWAAGAFATSAVVLYDPTRPDDAFGRQMLLNLRARGAPFVGITEGASPRAHAARLRRAGWERASCADMAAVSRRLLRPEALARACAREPLDELEEWHLFQAHYAIALGVSDSASGGLLAALQLPAEPGDSL
jgi:O-methyltransferase involved in polyketide biosynthesis